MPTAHLIEWVRDSRGCFICTSHKPSACYPKITRNRLRTSIARLILYKRIGFDISRWVVTRHTRDNKMCINPSHIIHGSLADNNRDTAIRGRTSRGERHRCAKLKESEVEYVRESNLSHAALGRMFGVTRQAIWQIRNGRKWRFTFYRTPEHERA